MEQDDEEQPEEQPLRASDANRFSVQGTDLIVVKEVQGEEDDGSTDGNNDSECTF